MLSFSQFGSDLDESTKRILAHGAVLMEALKQPQYSPFSLSRQVIALSCVKTGLLDNRPLSKINALLDDFYSRLSSLHPEIPSKIEETHDFSLEDEEAIKEELSAYLRNAGE